MEYDSDELSIFQKEELIWIELENGLCEIGNYQGIVSCGKNLHVKLFPYASVRNVLVDKCKAIEGIKIRRKINWTSESLEMSIMNSFYPNLNFIRDIKSGKEVKEELEKRGFSLEDYNNLFVRN